MKIEIEHVSKKIKDALVLDDVCMTLEGGNIYGFQGVINIKLSLVKYRVSKAKELLAKQLEVEKL